MKKLYRFRWSCGRMGDVEGTFVADDQFVKEHIGFFVDFGEILGKHSEICGDLSETDLTVLTEDQDFIQKFLELKCESGYNPLNYLRDEEGEEVRYHGPQPAGTPAIEDVKTNLCPRGQSSSSHRSFTAEI